MMNVRFTIFQTLFFEEVKLYLRSDMNVETPMMNMKKGKTKSVGVNPNQLACPSGLYIELHDPGLFTIIIPAIVIPRRISSDSKRCDFMAGIIILLLLYRVNLFI